MADNAPKERLSLTEYKAHPTLARFHNSNAFVKGVRGPLGSGKSVACCAEIFRLMCNQAVDRYGKRKTRFIVVRNTGPQLETTTIKTWLDWFPEHAFGKMNRKAPISHNIKIPELGVESEVIFLALDNPADAAKLKSLEATAFWFNEAREMHFSLVTEATSRVGRYPKKNDMPDGHVGPWPTWHGVIMDTNPSDDAHWWFECAENDAWAVDKEGKRIAPEDVSPAYRWEFFSQPSGMSKKAENLEFLPKGYYQAMCGGKTKEWIDVYVHGRYGSDKTGMPVYGSAWNKELMLVEGLAARPDARLFCGVDCSGRHPAAVVVQRGPRGHIEVLNEIAVTEKKGMAAVNFAPMLKAWITRHYPDRYIEYWGDPNGAWGSQNTEHTYFEILRAHGMRVRAPVGMGDNRSQIANRVETVVSCLCAMIDGKPKLVVDERCKVLARGMEGAYRYKTPRYTADESPRLEPEKNRFSDVQDALQYVLIGMGEMAAMKGIERFQRGAYRAKTNFSVFAKGRR
jgi:hypothetical protein